MKLVLVLILSNSVGGGHIQIATWSLDGSSYDVFKFIQCMTSAEKQSKRGDSVKEQVQDYYKSVIEDIKSDLDDPDRRNKNSYRQALSIHKEELKRYSSLVEKYFLDTEDYDFKCVYLPYWAGGLKN